MSYADGWYKIKYRVHKDGMPLERTVAVIQGRIVAISDTFSLFDGHVFRSHDSYIGFPAKDILENPRNVCEWSVTRLEPV